MKLAEILSTLPAEQLDRLAAEHIRSGEQVSRPTLSSALEGLLRSCQLIQEIVFRRQPPALSVLCALIDAPDHTVSTASLHDIVLQDTERLCALVTSGQILGRDEQLHLYRRILYETRRSDLQIDQSESAILGVLRRELGIAHIEHFLIEYHADLQEFWKHADSYTHELQALISVGLIFIREPDAIVASEMTPLIRRALGLDMSLGAARRLYSALPSSDIADALSRIDTRTTGTKDDRIERLLLNWVQPRSVLRHLSLGALRDLCREMNGPTSGKKEDIVERIIAAYARGADQQAPEQPDPAPTREDRSLDEGHFNLLFGSLKGAELGRILEAFPDLKQSGTKEARAGTLWDSHRSEVTLLGTMMNREIEDVLLRCGLRLGGSKPERIQRLIEHFRAIATSVQAIAGGPSTYVEERFTPPR